MQKTPQRIISILFLALLTLCITAPISFANSERESVVLTDTSKRVFIGEYAHITPQKSSNLTAEILAQRHKSNLLGKPSKHRIINLGHDSDGSWIVFPVKNTTKTENWVLHFGDLTDGRQALTKGIIIYEDHTKMSFVDTTDVQSESNMSRKNAFSLHIPQSKDLLFLVKLEAKGPFPHTVAPSLMSYDYYISNVKAENSLSSAFKILMSLLIGSIIALSLSHRIDAYLIFGIYILLQTSLFMTLEQNFLSVQGFLPYIVLFVFIAAIFAKWVFTQIFFLNTVHENKSMLALVISGAFIIICFIVSPFLQSTHIAIAQALTFFSIFISISLGTFIAGIFVLSSKRMDSFYLFASWCAFLTAFLFSTILFYGLLPAFSFYVNAFWLLIILQVIFGTVAIAYKINIDKEEEDTRRAREKRAEASMARLQQAKESSDQARLLRVIERERELMAELREREILRTEEMRKAKNMADEANRAKSGFLAVVSHEVRTPMNGIMGMIRLLNNTQMTKQQTEYLQSMQTSGDTMLALLNDILDFEKIESGNMELESIEFNMPKLVQDVITLMTGHANEKNTVLTSLIPTNFPSNLRGDPTRIRQVILNLVSNAIKFTENGEVKIDLKANNPEGTFDGQARYYEISCAVKDNGIGISKEAQETLFTPFTQAESSTTRKYGGTGLGLTICRHLVEAMHGKIILESEEGVGSTFTFTIRLQTVLHASSNTSDKPKKEKKKKVEPMNILIIEDNEINRRVLSGFLEQDNHKLTLRESAEDALELCQGKQFDLIITDINLGGMSGLDFTKNIRLFPNKKIASTPIVALSGNVAPEDIRTCYQANMNGFLEKPIDPDALYEMLFKIESGDFDQKIILPDAKQIERQAQTTREDTTPDEEEDDQNTPAEDVIILPPPTAKTDDSFSDSTQYNNDLDDDFDSFSDIPKIPGTANTPDKNEDTAPIMNLIKHVEQNQAALAPPSMPPSFETIDPDFLEMVAGSLPTDQVEELLSSFAEKADEIITDLTSMCDEPNADAIHEKSHELKGMASNFGMTLLTDISAIIEKSSKDGDLDTAIAEIKKLAGANQRAKEELNIWLENF